MRSGQDNHKRVRLEIGDELNFCLHFSYDNYE